MHKIIPQKTLTEAERKLLSLEARKNAVLLELLDVVIKTFDAVWEVPEEMFKAQGIQGETNMEQHALAVTYLLQAGVDVPVRYRSALGPYTTAPDGTVTPQ